MKVTLNLKAYYTFVDALQYASENGLVVSFDYSVKTKGDVQHDPDFETGVVIPDGLNGFNVFGIILNGETIPYEYTDCHFCCCPYDEETHHIGLAKKVFKVKR